MHTENFGLHLIKKEDDKKEKTPVVNECPDCGSILIYQEGCYHCPFCGYGRCGG